MLSSQSRTALVACLAGLSFACAAKQAQQQPPMVAAPASADHRQEVVNLLKSIETGSPEAASIVDTQHYTQHNLMIGDGLAGFAAVMQQLPKGSAKVKTLRVFQDGDFVFAHTDYNFFGPKIGFDVFRFENGKVVEHWDNLQETPAHANSSGHTMIDGPTNVDATAETEKNKTLVRSFADDILIHGRADKMMSYFSGNHYVQHDANMGDGLTGFGAGMQAMAKQGNAIKYEKIHTVLGERDFVLVISEGTVGTKPTAFYDLFRVEGGNISEHWDTMQTIPPKAEWKNSNGKF